MKASKISVIIPVYNEVNTLEQLLEKVENADMCSLEKEIILVDDGSVDGTRELLKKLENNYRILFHAKNMGKGAAVRTALYYTTGDIIVIQDADLEYNPDDYDELIKVIINNEADVAYGSRFLTPSSLKNFRFLQFWANKFLTFMTNLLFGMKLTDMETCYKAFRADVIRSISLKSNRFDFEPEISAKILKSKYFIKELPISYYGRTYDEGKKIGWKDGLVAIKALLWYRIFD